MIKSLKQKISGELRTKGFYLYLEEIEKTQKSFQKELEKALNPKNPRNITFKKSWSSFFTYGKSNKLTILELGGTFLKISETKIHPTKIDILKTEKYDFYRKKTYTPEILFNDLNKKLNTFFPKEKRKEVKDTVFIFTYPLNQFLRKNGKLDGICTNFAKNHKGKGIVGLTVGKKLEDYLRKNGFPNISVNLTNDAPPSLISAKKMEIEKKSYRFNGLINIIVGTGTNIAVGFDNNNKKFFVSNLEFGMFKSFPQSEYDKTMNKKTLGKGHYITEKMFAGAWRAKLFSTVCQSLIRKKILKSAIWKKMKMNKKDSKEFEVLFMRKRLLNDPLRGYKFVWDQITERGGWICGFALSQIILHLKKNSPETKFAVIEVGAILEKSSLFKEKMIKTMNSFLEKKLCEEVNENRITIDIFNPEKETVYGSAIIQKLLKKD